MTLHNAALVLAPAAQYFKNPSLLITNIDNCHTASPHAILKTGESPSLLPAVYRNMPSTWQDRVILTATVEAGVPAILKDETIYYDTTQCGTRTSTGVVLNPSLLITYIDNCHTASPHAILKTGKSPSFLRAVYRNMPSTWLERVILSNSECQPVA